VAPFFAYCCLKADAHPAKPRKVKMTDQKLPKQEDFHLPTLQAIQKLGGSATVSELKDALIEICNITDEQLEECYKDGDPKVYFEMSWARTSLNKIGFAENSERGVWSITKKGVEFLKAPRDEAEKTLNKIINEYYATNSKSSNQKRKEIKIWKKELLEILKKIGPNAFERLTMRLLREEGFEKLHNIGKPGDGGIDILGEWHISLISFPVLVQCKRYKGSVGPDQIRDFRGAMAGRTDHGLFITTGAFTKSARIEASRDGAPKINLINGEELCDLLAKYQLGIDEKDSFKIDKSFFESI